MVARGKRGPKRSASPLERESSNFPALKERHNVAVSEIYFALSVLGYLLLLFQGRRAPLPSTCPLLSYFRAFGADGAFSNPQFLIGTLVNLKCASPIKLARVEGSCPLRGSLMRKHLQIRFGHTCSP
jgi:hypothetical protein